ncbi:uncharacterized protein JN550_004588 [Neoarthrinium moseri]|uniref:uncharacterized protein n=1 Tax=Neoarthrinium moseri TaxID=1658444 RepID=UPI001FDE27C2|nr:uncharacterized protein JN550_004588 [Neoarthrinium moseri]KAI1871594.1 hypothetical protein JN550_004588 [Neoarthrinium moseri]
MDIDEPLLLFRAQFLQCIDHDFIRWPPSVLLQQPDAQSFLSKKLFNVSNPSSHPPASYEARVLKTLIAKIAKSVGSIAANNKALEDLSFRLASLQSMSPQEGPITQLDANVTYNCIPQNSRLDTQESWRPLTVVESRSLVAGSKFTGHRTWEGALHLASYLVSKSDLVLGKSILELGAGAGFISIMCAKYLGAARVVATDGDERVVKDMRRNLLLNELETEELISAEQLVWSRDLHDKISDGPGFDIVLGADIIYDKGATEALVDTLSALFDAMPQVSVLLSNAFRFPDVFEVFQTGCARNKLRTRVIDYNMTPPAAQKSLFYTTSMPLQIIEIQQDQLRKKHTAGSTFE